MRFTRNILITICLCLSVFAESALGKNIDEVSPEIKRVVEIIEQSANNLGYKAVRGYRPSDEWEAEEKKDLLESHAYYTLYGKDSDDSCTSSKGRIGVTILIFKDGEIARRHVAQMKEYHSGNIGIKIIKSDENGYYLEEVNGFYAAVIKGSKVVFFEDRSRAQREIVESLSEALAR